VLVVVLEKDKNNGIGYCTKQQTFKQPMLLRAVFVLSESTFEFVIQERN
jgi:hypothetical protein